MNPSAEAVRAMTDDWKAALQARIGTLSELRDHLEGCVGCGCLSLDHCPPRNPGDALAAKGAGPMRLDRSRTKAGAD